MSDVSIAGLKKKIRDFPRINLVHLPTPFQKAENITNNFQGPEIYIKRDDLTGLAFGGNKSRKLEFILSDVLAKKADIILTWASIQSNWCLQTAAAASKYGIKTILFLFKTYDAPEEYDGNLLLDYILEADIRIMEAEKGKLISDEEALKITGKVAEELSEKDSIPYVIPIGGSRPGGSMKYPLGAISYVQAFAELLEQAQKMGIEIDYIVHASGSGGTQAGLIVGAKALKKNLKVLGISVSEEKHVFEKDVLQIAQQTIEALELDISVSAEDVILFDDYIGEGYGVVDRQISRMIQLVAKKEGIFLDPVYTGKAMVALYDLARKKYLKKNDKVVFFHTGGIPALFPNKHHLVKYLRRSPE